MRSYRLIILASTIFVLLTAATPQPALQIHVDINGPAHTKDADFIEYYDCSTKTNGPNMHPCDCHDYIVCSNGNAFEKDCPSCETGTKGCPDGRLLYDASLE